MNLIVADSRRIVGASVCSFSEAQMKKLTEAQAVELAEKFIAQNGYSDLPPEKDKIVYESVECAPNVDEMR